eukprot:9502453-Pyramimonas_sp.AAC.1
MKRRGRSRRRRTRIPGFHRPAVVKTSPFFKSSDFMKKITGAAVDASVAVGVTFAQFNLSYVMPTLTGQKKKAQAQATIEDLQAKGLWSSIPKCQSQALEAAAA